MGGWTQAITQGVGRGGNEFSQARRGLLDERLNLLQLGLQLQQVKQRLEQSKKPYPYSQFTDEKGNVHAVVVDPQTGELTDKVLYSSGAQYPDFRTPQEALGYALQHGDTDLLKRTIDTIKATQREPATPAATQEYLDWKESFTKKRGREPNDQEIALWHRAPRAAAGTIPELPEKTLKALAGKWQKENIKPPAKYQAAVEEYMSEHNMEVRPKLSQQEQRLFDITKQLEPKVNQLVSLIEKNNLQAANSVWDAAKAKGKFYQYKAGIRPDKVHADLIKAAAALQVMGAAPWMQIGRGKYMFETITQHLPSPTDTPALLYDKAQFLRGLIEEARQSLPQSEEQLKELENFFDTSKLVPK